MLYLKFGKENFLSTSTDPRVRVRVLNPRVRVRVLAKSYSSTSTSSILPSSVLSFASYIQPIYRVLVKIKDPPFSSDFFYVNELLNQM